MDINRNGNENSINQQNDLIAKKQNEAVNNAIIEVKTFIRKSFSERIRVIPCIDSVINFEIELDYIDALTDTIMKILRHKFTTFYIMGMRGENDRDVVFECIVRPVMEM